MARRTISNEVKAQIVEAMQQEGSKASLVAKQFGVSIVTVYNYVKQAQVAPVETAQA